jgi:UDP-2,3-diacylglucosamine pyrophosphatase LpxH
MLDEKDAFLKTQERLIQTVEKLRQDFQVQIYFVLGNHDHNILYYLSLVVAQAYKNTEVKVFEGADRHYLDWGKTLIQMLHGDEKDALAIMVDEHLMKSRKSYDHLYSKG